MSENIFSTLLKRATYASSGNLISRIAASLAAIIIARAVGPQMFGVYAAVLALIEFSMAFTQVGIITDLKREGSRTPELISTLLGNVIIAQLLLSLGSMGIAFFALPLVSGNPLGKIVFFPLALVILSTVGAEPFLAVLQIRGEQRLASFFVGGRGLAFLGGIVALAVFHSDIMILAWYHAICYLIASLFIILSVVARVPLSLRPAIIWTQVRGGLPFGIAGAVWSAFINLPLLFLSHFGPEESVGNFAVALRFVMISIFAGTVANNEAFLPALFGLFRMDGGRFAKVCSAMQRLYISVGILGAAALYVCAEAVVIVVQGEEYRRAISLLRVLCWSVALIYGTFAADAAMMAGDRMRAKLMIQGCATIIVLLSCIPLISKYGAMGTSFAVLLGTSALLIFMLIYANAKKLYPFSGLLGILAPSVVTTLAAILLTASMPSRYFLVPSLFLAASGLVWYLYWILRPDRKEWGRSDA